MAKNIASLAVKLGLDTQDFADGTTLSKKELATLRKSMREVETPAEKLAAELEDLGKIVEKDARFQEVYNRKLDQFERELNGVDRAAADAGQSMGVFKAAIGAVVAAGVIDRLKDATVDAAAEIRGFDLADAPTSGQLFLIEGHDFNLGHLPNELARVHEGAVRRMSQLIFLLRPIHRTF